MIQSIDRSHSSSSPKIGKENKQAASCPRHGFIAVRRLFLAADGVEGGLQLLFDGGHAGRQGGQVAAINFLARPTGGAVALVVALHLRVTGLALARTERSRARPIAAREIGLCVGNRESVVGKAFSEVCFIDEPDWWRPARIESSNRTAEDFMATGGRRCCCRTFQ